MSKRVTIIRILLSVFAFLAVALFTEKQVYADGPVEVHSRSELEAEIAGSSASNPTKIKIVNNIDTDIEYIFKMDRV